MDEPTFAIQTPTFQLPAEGTDRGAETPPKSSTGQMTPEKALSLLLEGNHRFRTGAGSHFTYRQPDLEAIAQRQQPFAAIVACADSRLTPEAIFDQPLGALFVSRVPGNVASDSAKWMIDIAVPEFKVPLLVVMGHTGCLAVGQVVDNVPASSGGALRYRVANAVMRARSRGSEDLYYASVEENAKQALEDLIQESWALREAVQQGKTRAVAAVYKMESGEVVILE